MASKRPSDRPKHDQERKMYDLYEQLRYLLPEGMAQEQEDRYLSGMTGAVATWIFNNVMGDPLLRGIPAYMKKGGYELAVQHNLLRVAYGWGKLRTSEQSQVLQYIYDYNLDLYTNYRSAMAESEYVDREGATHTRRPVSYPHIVPGVGCVRLWGFPTPPEFS